MQLTSRAFTHNSTIPIKYTQHGDNINPPLDIKGIPERTQSLVLIVEDPDVPPQAGVPVWDHWIAFNIPTSMTAIPAGWQVQGVRGQGTRGGLDYSGPKPPDKQHRYFFKVYALDNLLDLNEGTGKTAVEAAMKDHILDQAELIGLFAPPASKFPRRLFQLREEGMLSGVCAGIGAYLNVDPTWIRILWVILAIFTSGAWIIVHLALILIIPVAKTPGDRDRAYGKG